jgi:hypothetical protein
VFAFMLRDRHAQEAPASDRTASIHVWETS